MSKVIAVYELSPLQEGILFHDLYERKPGAYVLQLTCDLENPDIEVFKKCWTLFLQRHSILRSAFNYRELSVPVQCVYTDVTVPFAIIENMEPEPFLQQDLETAFDLERPPLMRVSLIKVQPAVYKMVWTLHHIVCDGWSLPIMINELLSIYGSLLNGELPQPAEDDNYGDYIQYLQKKDQYKQEEFWKQYLSDANLRSRLPFIRSSPKGVAAADIQKITLHLDAGSTRLLEELAQRRALTVNTIFQGVWAFLLSRYMGNPKVTFGVTVSGRSAEVPEIDQRVGLYINTIPIKAVVPETGSVLDWLEEIQSGHVGAREYEHTPLSSIQKWAGIQHSPFDTIIVFENYPVAKDLFKDRGLKAKNVTMRVYNHYPLTLTIEHAKEINVKFTFDQDWLDREIVETIHAQFQIILAKMVSIEGVAFSDLARNNLMVSGRPVLQTGTATSATDEAVLTISDLFEQHAAAYPGRIAVCHGDEQVSYDELNKRANRIAHHLIRKYRAAERHCVGIVMERSPAFIAAMLGVLKTGAAYVPLDASGPVDRKAFILSDAKIKVLITDKSPESGLVSRYFGAVEVLSAISETSHDDQNPVREKNREALLYIMYTSGSTGQPKGVMIGHRSMLNYVRGIHRTIALPDTSRYATVTSLSTDLGNTAVFGAICSGGTLDIISRELLEDAAAFFKYCREASIDLIKFTPSLLYALIRAEPEAVLPFRYLLLGGEQLSWDLLERVQQAFRGKDIYNHYGPTETTVGITVNRVTETRPKFSYSVPIGSPLPNIEIYLLDKNMLPVDKGWVGEIYVAGPCLSPGYFDQPSLTEERFVRHPLWEGVRMYRTGDLARRLPDGDIEFIGRRDDQLKIRGYRVEPGEVEEVIRQYHGIRDCLVLGKEDAEGNRSLVGYFIPAAGLDHLKLQGYLQEYLPDYMIPGDLIELEEFPLTSNGKINREALPEPRVISQEHIPPRTEIEKRIAGIWQEVLEIEKIGVSDNLFRLGGHSLSAIRILAAIQREFDIDITVQDIFTYPTLEGFSRLVEGSMGMEGLPRIEAGERGPSIPLSYAQERLWFIDRLEGSVQYHMPMVLRVEGPLDVGLLSDCFGRIVGRHEVLRTVFLEQGGRVYQRVMDEGGWVLDHYGEGSLIEGVGSEGWLHGEVNRAFDLGKDYMLRVSVVSFSREDHLLVLVLHHIAGDGWSKGILLGELSELYGRGVDRGGDGLAGLPLQYADYAIWQRRYMTESYLEKQLEWWEGYLKGVERLSLPTDRRRGMSRSYRGGQHRFSVGEDIYKELLALSVSMESTLFMTLLSVFKVLLYRYSGQEDICVGTPVARRQRQELEPLIGYFLNTVALRTEVRGDMSFSELVRGVKESTLSAFGRQDTPFEQVIERVVRERDMSRSPLFDVMFGLQNTPEAEIVELEGLRFRGEDHGELPSKNELVFSMLEYGGGLHVTIEYRRDLFDEGTIVRLGDHYRQLLSSVVKDKGTAVGELRMLQEEEEALLRLWSGRDWMREVGGCEGTVLRLFSEQVRRQGGAIALSEGEGRMSYREVEERSNQLGRYLCGVGVGKGVLVGLSMDRSMEMIVGLLGILKAGGVYVPVDRRYPLDRQRYMVQDSGMRHMLVKGGGMEWSEVFGVNRMDVEELRDRIGLEGVDVLEERCEGRDVAYVLYTSGSTGRPKGVLIEHGGAANLALRQRELLGLGERDCVLQFASLSFDASWYEIFNTLCSGGRLVLSSEEVLLSEVGLGELLGREGVNVVTLPPSYQLSVERWLYQMRVVVSAGEAMEVGVAERLSSAGVEVVNAYGPTENTVCASLTKEPLRGMGRVSIGHPLRGVCVEVRDRDGSVAPQGVVGELYIGGVQLSRGYINGVDQTSQRFGQEDREGIRWYRSGDQVRWMSGGHLEYVGRGDDQVKIRGHRVEPGEIEAVLEQLEGVRRGVVLADRGMDGQQRLLGYVVMEEGVEMDREAIIGWLGNRLPQYMVPRHWVEVDRIPLTSSGKTDRRALQEMAVGGQTGKKGEYEAPQTEVERKLAEIWQRLLGVERIGRRDNFFELGGHSMLIMRLMTAVDECFNTSISVRMLFEFSTISQQADIIEAIMPDAGETERQMERLKL
jgi:amino acid adenylation domain-containing protein